MSEVKHTPGPWVGDVNCVVTSTGKGIAILEPDPAPGFWGDEVVPVYDQDEAAANLALIVAAPDLLAACQLALEQLYHCDCSNGVTTPMGDRDEGTVIAVQTQDALQAAIAKATGK